MSTNIVMRQEFDGAMPVGVVVSAPDVALVSAHVLADIALGRANDASVSDLGLTAGVEGRGLGRVHYRVDEYDPNEGAYRVVLIGVSR